MSEPDALDERLRAVERALTDGDRDLTDLRTGAELTREVEALCERLDDAEDRLDELDAATQALRGYVGSVRAVNESVERRADAALAKAESLETDRQSRSGRDSGADSDFASDSDPGLARHPGPTCDCERRRADPSEWPGTEAETAPDESPGLLARLAEALS
ncbi:hypothetical protein NGM10_04020 [Halorussus salilacus]|uniref:DUF7310 family coiled-coil domain-containing protein n=1 Tax=Halorussus salilacus TaxID=2953750 RepID=UPI0020A2061F|nr:hypothetical protein [Halorussus salilacus]USZ68907.1 hypothetical protein NGM10_04020 [Halorussus salilacus]